MATREDKRGEASERVRRRERGIYRRITEKKIEELENRKGREKRLLDPGDREKPLERGKNRGGMDKKKGALQRGEIQEGKRD